MRKWLIWLGAGIVVSAIALLSQGAVQQVVKADDRYEIHFPLFQKDFPHGVDDFEKAVNEAIMTCNGNMRATIRSLLVANGFLEEERERLAASISNGFARGTHRKKKQQS